MLFKYVFMVDYFSMFLYIYICYFLDNDNFTNISLSYFLIFYVISLSLGDHITTTLAASVLPVCSEENS